LFFYKDPNDPKLFWSYPLDISNKIVLVTSQNDIHIFQKYHNFIESQLNISINDNVKVLFIVIIIFALEFGNNYKRYIINLESLDQLIDISKPIL
jgi:hypothetical protein